MRSRRVLAVSTLTVTALAGAALGAPAAAGEGDDRDKNTLLAEAQFQLFLLTANFEPSDITCTRPPVRDMAGELLCYALVSDRVSVAAIASMESPGVYSFTPLNKVDPADLDQPADDVRAPEPPPVAETPPTTTEAPSPQPPSSEPPSSEPPSSEPPSSEPAANTDQAILDSIEFAVSDSDGLSSVLTDNNESIQSLDTLAYHAPTSTVQVTVTTDSADPAARDGVAFFVTDVMAYLWEQSQPTRQSDATIHPRLEVTVDEVIYGSAFDVMVQVADYTITEGEWLEIVTGDAALTRALQPIAKPTLKPAKPALKTTSKWVPKFDATHKHGVAPAAAT
jgi:hypothetical protein